MRNVDNAAVSAKQAQPAAGADRPSPLDGLHGCEDIIREALDDLFDAADGDDSFTRDELLRDYADAQRAARQLWGRLCQLAEGETAKELMVKHRKEERGDAVLKAVSDLRVGQGSVADVLYAFEAYSAPVVWRTPLDVRLRELGEASPKAAEPGGSLDEPADSTEGGAA